MNDKRLIMLMMMMVMMMMMTIIIIVSSQLSVFGRCEYEKTCQLLISLFDQSAQRYQELVRNNSASTTDLTIEQGNQAISDHISIDTCTRNYATH